MIEFINISKQFSDRIVLDRINFKVNKKEKLLIKGKSGSGKSTIFNLILRYEKPNHGSIIINDKEISSYTSSKLRKMIAWLPQKLNSLGDTNLDELLKFIAISDSAFERNDLILREYFERLSLDYALHNTSFAELSGGELQRMGVVITKLLNREIILLDEPTSALDNETSSKAIDFLLDSDATVICITHSNDFDNIFDNIINLNSK